MRKLKNFFDWCVAGTIVGFVGVSFIIGAIWTICSIVEKIASIIL